MNHGRRSAASVFFNSLLGHAASICCARMINHNHGICEMKQQRTMQSIRA